MDEKDSGSNVADSDSHSGSWRRLSMVVFRKWKQKAVSEIPGDFWKSAYGICTKCLA